MMLRRSVICSMHCKETCPDTPSELPLLPKTSSEKTGKQQYLKMCFSLSILLMLSMLCWKLYLNQIPRGEKHTDINFTKAILASFFQNREVLGISLEEKIFLCQQSLNFLDDYILLCTGVSAENK